MVARLNKPDYRLSKKRPILHKGGVKNSLTKKWYEFYRNFTK